MFQTSLNQYFFDSELSNFPAPLFALIVPLIVFRKKRVWNLMLMEVMYSIMFLNCALGLIFYKRYISDLDLFTAINLGILVDLIPFRPNIKKIVAVLLCILIIAPIATTAYKEEKKINHENEINYSELSAYLFLKGKNGTLFTDYKHASWAYAITKINTSTLAFSKNRDIALRIYFGSEDNNRVFEKPYYLVYNEGILSRYKKIFDNGGTEVRVL
ncbi:MAG: hypothetical protein ACE5J3_08610 [Methanosarcinales archaeon]